MDKFTTDQYLRELARQVEVILSDATFREFYRELDGDKRSEYELIMNIESLEIALLHMHRDQILPDLGFGYDAALAGEGDARGGGTC